MERLQASEQLIVRQRKEMGEILTGFETRNIYHILDARGVELYRAGEEGGSVLTRIFLRAMRPFRIRIEDLQGNTVLHLVRPFRFFFHRVDIYDARDNHLGAVQRRFSFVRRVYSILDSMGRELCDLFGPLLRPWTFKIRRDGEDLGRIAKRWSGLFKEGFTDADNFGVEFPAGTGLTEKALLMGAVFLVDFVHFENTNR